jgi:hypothetical protein
MTTPESYIDSLRPKWLEAAERKERVQEAAALLREIFRHHAIFTDGLLRTPAALLNPADPEEITWLLPLDYDDGAIEQERVSGIGEEERWLEVFSVRCKVGSPSLNATPFTVCVRPPENVLGNEKEPLDSARIAGVLVDMERYRTALAEGRISE